MSNLKKIIDLTLILFCGALNAMFFYFFLGIAEYGKVTLREPNIFLLYIEIAASALIVVISIIRAVQKVNED